MRPHIRAWIGAVLVGALALGALVSTAVHATSAAGQLVSAQALYNADYSNAYFSCLEAQGHQLLRPNDVAFVAQHDLAHWVIITKAVGGFVHLTEYRSQATVAVLVVNVPRHSHDKTCDGQSMVTIRRTPSGRVVMVRAGAGAPS